MLNRYDLAYAAGLIASAPGWLAHPRPREKVLAALGQRMGHVRPRDSLSPCVLIHAVSLGEMNATAELARQLRASRPDLAVVVSVTTETGYARGRQLYPVESGVQLVRWPLDFSPAVNGLLDAVRPSVVVLIEGELWPNFLLQCERRRVPVVLVNGRVTPSSFATYRRFGSVTAAMMRRLAAACVQDDGYAEQFRQLGATNVTVTGTMKFDTATVADRVEGDAALAAACGLSPGEPVWVCGSTGPGEEDIILDAYARLTTLNSRLPTADSRLRLVIVPRHPQRFDAVADLIQSRGLPLFRRSTNSGSGIILGDTMGELRAFYGLATVVFVGRSLVDLGHRQRGSDMIEPAALAKPVAVGPWTHNFADAVRAFRAADAIAEVADGAALARTIGGWLADPAAASAVGRRAQAVVRQCRGATARHVGVILTALDARRPIGGG